MADTFQVKTEIDASGTAAGGAQTAEELAKIAAAAAATQEEATRLGVSLEMLQQAKAQIAKEDATAAMAKLKAQLREVAEEAANVGGASGAMASDLQQAGSAGESAFTDLHKAVNENERSILTSRRSVTHLVEGLRELGSGGVAALGGVATEGFLAAEAFEATLGPLYPIFAAVTLIGSIAIPMFESWSEKSDAAKEKTGGLRSETEGLKQAAEAAAQLADELGKKRLQALDDELQRMGMVTSEMEKQAGYAKTRREELEKEKDATKNLTLAQLEMAKQKDLSTAGSPENRADVERDYANRSAQVNAGSEAERYALQKQGNADDIAAKNREIDSTTREKEKAEKDLADLRARAAGTAQDASEWGIQPNAAGSYKTAIDALQLQITDARASLDRTRKEGGPVEGANENSIAETIADLTKELKSAQEAERAGKELADKQKELTEKTGTLNDSIEKLTEEIKNLRTEGRITDTRHATAVTKEQEEAQKQKDDAAQAALDEQFKNRQAGFEAQAKDLEAKQGAKNLTPDGREALQKQIDQVQIQALNDRLVHGTGGDGGKGTLEESQITTLQGEIAALNTKLGVQQANAAGADAATGTKSVVADASAFIKAHGNKQELEELRRALEEKRAQGGKADPVAEIAALFSEVLRIDAEAHGKYTSIVSGLQARMDELQHAINDIHTRN